MKYLLTFLLLVGASIYAGEQDNWPKEAICLVCHPSGDGPPEPVRAASDHDGITYYFCNTECKTRFDASPLDFIPVPIPRPLPQLEVRSLVDTTRTLLAASTNGVMLIDVWATWCKPCAKLVPKLNELHAKLDDSGIEIVGIAVDEEGASKVAPYVKKKKLSYRIMLDPGGEFPVWKQLGVRSIPTLLAVDKSGIIRYQWSGDQVDFVEVESRLRQLAGETVSGG